MKIIDAHTHVFPQYAHLAVKVMDKCGIECGITLEWHDGFGADLKEHIKIFNQYSGRFIVFGNIDFSKINEKGFAKAAAEQMEEDVEAGMRGIKIYKSLGLEYKDGKNKFWRISDERLDPIWAKAAELGIPILIHTADPAAFWQPVNKNNFWNKVLCDEYAWWSYYRKKFPCRDELLAQRNEVIKRHVDTIFICPHVGNRADTLDLAASDLETMPNIYYDLSARIPILGLPGKRSQRTKEFLIQYQDRIIFGTDSIYDDTNISTGIQAQCLYQPGQIAIGDTDPKDKYIETSVEFAKSNIDFLTTDKIQVNPPFNRNKKGFSIKGVNLLSDVSEKICYYNIKKLLKIK